MGLFRRSESDGGLGVVVLSRYHGYDSWVGCLVSSRRRHTRYWRDWSSDVCSSDRFDAAVVNFPDPNSFALGKLYTTRFYRMLRQRLAPDAAVSIQSTSPLFARSSYWCIVRTLEAAGLHVRPYHAAVPSFGVWGFALARRAPFEAPAHAPPVELKFLDDRSLPAMFMLSADLGPVPVEVNRLDNQSLVRYYEAEWRRFE